MTITIDTNIILDLIWQRQPFFSQAREIFKYIESGLIEGRVTATSVTTLFYLVEKESNREKALDVVSKILQLCDVNAVNKDILLDALQSDFSDFEDAVIDKAAEMFASQVIITRNTKDFKHSELPVYHPEVFVAMMQAENN